MVLWAAAARRILRHTLLLSATCAAWIMAFPGHRSARAEVGPDQVRGAILRSVAQIKSLQRPDGTWPDYAQEGGVTALSCYALAQAGVAPGDPSLEKGLAALARVPDDHTYVVALKALAWSSADPEAHRERIQAAADWLAGMQRETGGWGYGKPPEELPLAGTGRDKVLAEARLERVYERTDASNTQFAILALSEAERAGARVQIDVWRRAERHLRLTQFRTGGWTYVGQTTDPGAAYGSVTAAMLASLYLCHDRLAPTERPETSDERQRLAERAFGWLEENYTLDGNPNRGRAWYYVWLYSLERAGVASGRRTFGGHDWFREGAERLVKGQRSDGSWTDRPYQNALCLLFLAKGFRPLLIQRLQWPGRWRQGPRDLDHLVRYLDSRLAEGPVAWQTLDCEAPLEDYLAAPLLHVTGRGPIRMLASSVAQVRRYVEQGGIVVLDAQGGDEAFTESARRLAGDLFPEAEFEALPPNHPIYRARHEMAPQGLESLNLGCRASVLLAPKGLADGWAAGDPDVGNDALRLGENLAAFAAGGPTATHLPDRLHEVTVLKMPQRDRVPRGALQIGQVFHTGDWRPRPFALPTLLEDLSRRFGLTVLSRPDPVRLADDSGAELLENVRTYPMLYLVGHHRFELEPRERAALKVYLERGGYLWAEACCGRKAFDAAFRELVAEMFPERRLERLGPDHPILKSEIGHRIERVTYSPTVREAEPDLTRPVLYGMELDGHLAIVYSPYGIGVGLDGIRTWGARALEPDSAHRVATNIVLYALTH